MPEQDVPEPTELKEIVLRILDDSPTLAVATLRADGWPQTTIVGFVHHGLKLYFAAARTSQKVENIKRDPRVSIAIGMPARERHSVRGLSLAAHAAEVTDWHEIDRLNGLIRERYPEVDIFAPRESDAAIIRATPLLLSLVDDAHGIHRPVILGVTAEGELRPPGES